MKQIYRQPFNWEKWGKATADDIAQLSYYQLLILWGAYELGRPTPVHIDNARNHANAGKGSHEEIDKYLLGLDELYNDGIIQRRLLDYEIYVEQNDDVPQHFKDLWEEARTFVALKIK